MGKGLRTKQDKRYKNSEKRLRQALSEILKKNSGTLRVSNAMIIRKAKVFPSNFYRHYHNADDMLSTIRAEAMAVVNDVVAGYSGDMKNFFFQLLAKICQNAEVFKILYHHGGLCFWQELLTLIRPVVTRSRASYGRMLDDSYYWYFSVEFIGILLAWGKLGFSPDGLEHCFRQLMRLTEAGVKRQQSIAVTEVKS